MKKMYLLEGNKWLKVLGKRGFTWEREGSLLGCGVSMFEQFIDRKSSSAYVVDIERKTVSFFPLEIYAPQSPTSDNKKYQYYLSKCGDWNALMKDVKNYGNSKK